MDLLRRTQSFVVILATVIAVLAVCATPVHAAIAADFNGDGVLDQIVLSQAPGSGIIISISGSPLPQVLKLADPPLTILAVDLDRDGDVDLSAVSRQHRLYVWMNQGRGLFKRLRARFHHIGLQAPHAELLPTGHSRETAPAGQTNPSVLIAVEHVRAKLLSPKRRRVLSAAQPTPTRDCTGCCVPRAPPATPV